MTIVSEIKLIRTDTTLDLSQKAEKVCFFGRFAFCFVPTRDHGPVTGPAPFHEKPAQDLPVPQTGPDPGKSLFDSVLFSGPKSLFDSVLFFPGRGKKKSP